MASPVTTFPETNGRPGEVPGFAVGGLTQLTTLDLPGRLSAVVFCQGCPWQCGYCHNPHLIPRGPGDRPWSAVLRFLERRRGLLDAVVFSGGEPTLQSGLGEALREAREMGFLTGLHTGGPYPERLARVLPLVDWVGFDLKAPLEDYARITGVPGSGDRAAESARLLMASGVDHEFRTTVDPSLLSTERLLTLARWLADRGVQQYVLQRCRPPPVNDRDPLDDPTLIERLRAHVPHVVVR
ncbi:anaerobic ribonucleoside-triphosphate reductase activating protein [Thioalkalivibrio denitrificans]|uniref:Anaerobic ribonucleoside-triphosphate reductase activating protein n=1 Tax=Thioalkalivibrio denitrificans TaxID=108003 RepID=A0A1V3NFB4_9GAMM|nr:anaerobic ribonucleoside-triphosphate reductase activating protein [Thioalkalivibrio denitrificans]OOG23694.1 anaerobic ribonucleoside-triphosphate reductase activating protein [Thioalkalivibrio denitrificans]